MGEHKLEKMEMASTDARPDPDKQHADEIRKEAMRIIGELVALNDRANRYGLVLNFQITRNAIGLHMLNDLSIMKIM